MAGYMFIPNTSDGVIVRRLHELEQRIKDRQPVETYELRRIGKASVPLMIYHDNETIGTAMGIVERILIYLRPRRLRREYPDTYEWLDNFHEELATAFSVIVPRALLRDIFMKGAPKRRVLQVLAEGGRSDPEELARALGQDLQQAEELMYRLEENHLIERHSREAGFDYMITERGKWALWLSR